MECSGYRDDYFCNVSANLRQAEEKIHEHCIAVN